MLAKRLFYVSFLSNFIVDFDQDLSNAIFPYMQTDYKMILMKIFKQSQLLDSM